MHSLMNLTVFIVNISTLCSYLCILHLKWCVYQFIIIIIIYIDCEHSTRLCGARSGSPRLELVTCRT